MFGKIYYSSEKADKCLNFSRCSFLFKLRQKTVSGEMKTGIRSVSCPSFPFSPSLLCEHSLIASLFLPIFPFLSLSLCFLFKPLALSLISLFLHVSTSLSFSLFSLLYFSLSLLNSFAFYIIDSSSLFSFSLTPHLSLSFSICLSDLSTLTLQLRIWIRFRMALPYMLWSWLLFIHHSLISSIFFSLLRFEGVDCIKSSCLPVAFWIGCLSHTWFFISPSLRAVTRLLIVICSKLALFCSKFTRSPKLDQKNRSKNG